MSDHTPGPWFVVNVGSEDMPHMEVMAARIAGRPPRHCVAMCCTGDNSQEMENANARLIASAPTLLSIAKRWAALDGGSWHLVRHASEKNELLADTGRAIAEAEGRA